MRLFHFSAHTPTLFPSIPFTSRPFLTPYQPPIPLYMPVLYFTYMYSTSLLILCLLVRLFHINACTFTSLAFPSTSRPVSRPTSLPHPLPPRQALPHQRLHNHSPSLHSLHPSRPFSNPTVLPHPQEYMDFLHFAYMYTQPPNTSTLEPPTSLHSYTPPPCLSQTLPASHTFTNKCFPIFRLFIHSHPVRLRLPSHTNPSTHTYLLWP